MKCVIIANGDLDPSEETAAVIRGSAMIVCADGGARHLRAMGILPHIFLGDFDSAHPDDKRFFEENRVPMVAFPSRKDQTDSELCVSWALRNHATDFTFLGFTGSRMDHTLANIYLLKQLAERGIPARIIDRHNEIRMVSDTVEITGRPGDFLSLIPITEKVSGINITGLDYPLTNAVLEMGSSLGISNMFRKSIATVSVRNGLLLVIRSRD